MSLPVKSNTVTIDDLKRALPSRKNSVTTEIVDYINNSLNEPEFQGESLLQTATTYEKVLAGKTTTGLFEYLRALKFCAYMVSLDDNYTEAYIKTFSDRDFVASRMSAPTESSRYRELTSAASRYRRSRLVVDILTHSQIPLDMLFTGKRYEACMVLAELMVSSKLDKDKIAAAKELLAATKGAENIKIDLGVTTQENSATQNLMDQLAGIAARQQKMLESGASSLGEFGALRVVNAEGNNDE